MPTLSSPALYVIAGLLFLAAFAFALPEVGLHGGLFLLVGAACFGVAARDSLRRGR